MSNRFYCFHQNNSGGSFRGPAINVIIEAASPEIANSIAEDVGLYFDNSRDCPCCGDRWLRAHKYDGTKKPEIYGKSIKEHMSSGSTWGDEEKPEVLVVYANNVREKHYVT